MARKSQSQGFEFEKSLQTLDLLIQELEKGELPLEQSIQRYEEGVRLIQQCETFLKQAEQKIELLTEAGLETLPTEEFFES